ncbi:MAG: methylornithine synthase PylB [Desulfobacula sp.]|jgi:methylornithine synthase|uniref:methylornithine synthase PylB n=1 Tax=Desulfobacula sp. TaxID=2593537 RepID=UPI001D2B6E9A|nr:methylornithine synthase PylB [Desulfobacula sp.]MBT4026937.1 methylornithine synthase PylB [Desulfobacula sp.]MBT4198617.1 methylornithine synthase PylB [Desulfobacula sp.]MBT4505536.1 methylornithine synthase PylB [Desulfobacula sp.]MBT4874659.1 methylornithine synthase PylB [Desulfobacula sp.]
MKIDRNKKKHIGILHKALQEQRLSRQEILLLLKSRPGLETDLLFKTARQLREKYFDNKIFLYGFVYNSTHCRNNCRFCYYRKDNTLSKRYSKSKTQILDISCKLAESGVHLIDLTMGESVSLTKNNVEKVFELCNIIVDIKKQTHLPVMVSPGVLSEWALRQIADFGADFYACYQETHNPDLFSRLRKDQSFSQRLAVKQKAARLNLLTEEGILCGVGETLEDVADSFDAIKKLCIDQVRVMGFVPQTGTPMENHPMADVKMELVILAVLRLLFPDRLIPASLDVEGVGGLEKRLDAGANVVTSIVPAGNGLAGVAQNSLDIEDSRRTVAQVEKILLSCGDYEIARPEIYKTWIKQRKKEKFNFLNSPSNLKAI